MKRILLSLLCLVALTLPVRSSGVINLRPSQWAFEEQTTGEGFSVRFTYQAKEIGTTLIEVPSTLKVSIIDGRRSGDDFGQNYVAAPLPDGSVPVLEATLSLRLPTKGFPIEKMRVGVPLASLRKPWGKHEVILSFTGARLTLYVDGQLVDNDFPLGEPQTVITTNLTITSHKSVSECKTFCPALKATRIPSSRSKTVGLQYFTPEGHNAWVGDVATCYFKGRYHLFYLYDRRGHRSKFGRGGHYFEHLSTSDFLTWTEHEEATPIEEQWESFGTGTPFVLHDSLFLSYGMHTSRIYPAEQTSTPQQWDYIRANGESQAIPFSSLKGVYPSGASYSVATDGLEHFEKSHLLIHPAENPTIYTDDEGQLMMLANYGARGTWTSDRLNGGWRCVSEDFPPGGDCTFIFRWGNFDYIVGGFTHQWMKRNEAPITDYRDMVAAGIDFYDGLSVPAITEMPDGRHIMAGWMELNRHWGGPLVLRELVQYPDGRIGSRWMPELMPPVKSSRTLSKALETEQTFATKASSFMLTMDLQPKPDGRLSLLFLPDNGEADACEWRLDVSDLRAQFADGRVAGESARQKSLREGGQPHKAVNYAIENVDLKPYTPSAAIPVRVIARWSPKFGGTVIDVEINGRRTMICYRHGLRPDQLLVRPAHVAVSNLRLAPLKH